MSTTPWSVPLTTPLRRSRTTSAKWLPAACLALVIVGGVAVFVAFPTYPAYDSLYALLWANEIWGGQLPGFDDYRAPTQHPLLLPVGLVLAPLGDAGARAFVALCLAGMVALTMAVYRLGKLVAGVPGGLIAGGLLLTRFNFGLLASKGYLDIPYCALVAWAMALEAERPRRGGAVWWLLGLAGLLRPEAWLLAGVYGLWLGHGRTLAGRARALVPAAAAPALWAATDFVVTGDPLFSIHHTDALAAELQREIAYSRIPGMTVSLLAEILKPPLLLLAAAGIALAIRDRRRALAVPAVVAVVTCATYLVIATGGLATVYRYLLLSGLGLLLFAAYALSGWARLPRGSAWRTRWIAAVLVAGMAGAGYTAARLSPSGMVDQLRERTQIRTELAVLLHDPAVRTAAACGPVTVPNHKLLPEVRWALDLPVSGVRARSDRTLRPGAGVAITVAALYAERPALNVYEVPADGQRLNVAPAGHVKLAQTRHFAAWGRC